MAYTRSRLAESAAALLAERPLRTASDISAHLEIHRHTLLRALQDTGTSLAKLREQVVLKRLVAHGTTCSSTPLKQVWSGLGFGSASAFARFVRRATGLSPTEVCGRVGRAEPKMDKMDLDVLGGNRS